MSSLTETLSICGFYNVVKLFEYSMQYIAWEDIIVGFFCWISLAYYFVFQPRVGDPHYSYKLFCLNYLAGRDIVNEEAHCA